MSNRHLRTLFRHRSSKLTRCLLTQPRYLNSSHSRWPRICSVCPTFLLSMLLTLWHICALCRLYAFPFTPAQVSMHALWVPGTAINLCPIQWPLPRLSFQQHRFLKCHRSNSSWTFSSLLRHLLELFNTHTSHKLHRHNMPSFRHRSLHKRPSSHR